MEAQKFKDMFADIGEILEKEGFHFGGSFDDAIETIESLTTELETVKKEMQAMRVAFLDRDADNFQELETVKQERDEGNELLKLISTVFPACNGWYFEDANAIGDKLEAFLNKLGDDK